LAASGAGRVDVGGIDERPGGVDVEARQAELLGRADIEEGI
jgi:hypothetical protein